MKCPLMFNGAMAVAFKEKAPGIDCLEEECAWYDKEYKVCAFARLEQTMIWIHDVFTAILSKLPKAP